MGSALRLEKVTDLQLFDKKGKNTKEKVENTHTEELFFSICFL